MEKSPPDTIRSRWLQEHFSPCRFIAMVRHPCAVAEGIRRREGHDIGAAARHWARANQILRSDFRHLRYRTLVRYEELCENPVGTLNHLADFLSIPAEFGSIDLEKLDLHSLDEDVETVENFNPRSFGRLSKDDLAVIASEAGDVAEEFGYRIPPNACEA